MSNLNENPTPLTVTKRETYHSTRTWQPAFMIETFGYGAVYAITFLKGEDRSAKLFDSYEDALAYGNAITEGKGY